MSNFNSSQYSSQGFIRSIYLDRENVRDWNAYPYTISTIAAMQEIALDPKITFLVGENGSGKSTLLEAIAVNAGFNAEGGSKNFSFSTRSSESVLHELLKIVRNPYREKTGFFLRAESYYNVATEIEKLDKEPGFGPPIIDSYGGVSLHEQSHGESFMALAQHRFHGNGLYILDEPEAALSPARQLALLRILHKLIENNSQCIIATHSPILMAYPGATIYLLGNGGIKQAEYEETEHYRLTRDFLEYHDAFIKKVLADE
jgi:predicted ATPase